MTTTLGGGGRGMCGVVTEKMTKVDKEGGGDQKLPN